jgi:transcriptional regulator with XRE-family HTH domain
MNALRIRRLNAGKTIAEMAESTGLSRYTIMRLEGPSRVRAQAPTAKAVADFYGVQADVIFTADGEVRAVKDMAA